MNHKNVLSVLCVTIVLFAFIQFYGCKGGEDNISSSGDVIKGQGDQANQEEQQGTKDIGVYINPQAVSVKPGEKKMFTSSVPGQTNTNVTWSIVESGGGSIDSYGSYTAPWNVGTYHIKAVSKANSGKSATAMVTVTNTTPVSEPFPKGTWVALGTSGLSFTITSSIEMWNYATQYCSGTIYYRGGIINISKTNPTHDNYITADNSGHLILCGTTGSYAENHLEYITADLSPYWLDEIDLIGITSLMDVFKPDDSYYDETIFEKQ